MDRVAQWILGAEAVLAILALLAVLVLAIRRGRRGIRTPGTFS